MSLLQVEIVDDVDSHKYVHSLLDFLLAPEKLDAHLVGLRTGSIHFPTGPDLIRVCLQQAMAAQNRDAQIPAPAQGDAAPQASAVGSIPQQKRSKLLNSWASKMGHVLELPLETIERELPINLQQPLLMLMCQHYPNDRRHEVDFYRWIIRALMRNVGLNFITPSLSTEREGIAEGVGKEEREKKPIGDASIPARTFLKNWLTQHRDFKLEETTPDADHERQYIEKYLLVVPFELGEFHFFIEDFAEAERLFLLAQERATSFTTKYPNLDAKKWPIARERAEGFLRACRMIGYRVHTKDSPLRAALGLTGLIEDLNLQQDVRSSSLMIHLEELRLSLASVQSMSMAEDEKIKRREELTWQLLEALLRDNYSDDISWSYRLYLAQCADLAFMRGHLVTLNDMKLVLRGYSLSERSSASVFTSSILLPLRSLVPRSQLRPEQADYHSTVASLPPSLKDYEALLPTFPQPYDPPSTPCVHLPRHVLRFLFAASIDAIKRFSVLGPLRYGAATSTLSTGQHLSAEPVSEDTVKDRIRRLLFQTAQNEDTIECWESLRRLSQACGLTSLDEAGPPASMRTIDAALCSAHVHSSAHREGCDWSQSMLSEDSRKRRRQPYAAPEGLFMDSMGCLQLPQLANSDVWRQRNRGKRRRFDLSSLSVLKQKEPMAELSCLAERAKHFLDLGQIERGFDTYNQLASLADAREKSLHNDKSRENDFWLLRQDVAYGHALVDILRWEEQQLGKRKESEVNRDSDSASREGSTSMTPKSLMVRLLDLLRNFGPPQRTDTLVTVLAFLINSRQWETNVTTTDTPLAGEEQTSSQLHQYCRHIETYCNALLQQQRRDVPPQLPLNLASIPSPLATAWSIPSLYMENLELAILLADLCILATLRLRTLMDNRHSDDESDRDVGSMSPATPTDSKEEAKEEMEEGEAKEDSRPPKKTLTSMIRNAFDSLLDYLVVPQSTTIARSALPRLEWSANRGLLSLIRDETCLESLVGLFAGSLYHIQKQAQVPSMLLVEGYGHLAQLASRDSFHDSSRASPQIIGSLWEVFRATLLRLNKTQPQSERWLFGLGDAAYEVSHFGDAVRYYLLGGGLNNSFFCDPTAPISVEFQRTIPRLITSLMSIRAYLEAAVLCQFLPSPDYATAFKAVQSNPAALCEPYFQYLWEIPILELLVNIYTKMGQTKRAAFLIDLIGQKELNEHNGSALRSGFVRHMKQQFLKSLCRQFLLPKHC